MDGAKKPREFVGRVMKPKKRVPAHYIEGAAMYLTAGLAAAQQAQGSRRRKMPGIEGAATYISEHAGKERSSA